MDINDPLSNLSVQDTKGTNENEETDDIFKSAFKVNSYFSIDSNCLK